MRRERWQCWALGALLGGCGQAGIGETDVIGPGAAGEDAAMDGAGAEGGSDGGTDAGGTAQDGSPGFDGGTDGAAVDSGSIDSGGNDASAGEGGTTDAASDAPVADGSPDAEAGTGDCVAGTYEGSFEGTLSLSILGFFDLTLFDISGDIQIEALTSDTGDTLTIDDGSIEGADDDGNPVSADVSGVLNCATGMLEGGTLSNGVYVREAISQTVNFEGTVEAIYYPGAVPRVEGIWMTAGGVESGEGTFEASLVAPAP